MKVLMKPTASASAELISAAATRMKGKFTDMVPVNPGSLILSRAARHATTRNTAKRTEGIDLAFSAASPMMRMPEKAINATKTRDERHFGMLVLSVRSVTQTGY